MSRVSVTRSALALALQILDRNAERHGQPTMRDAADELRASCRDIEPTPPASQDGAGEVVSRKLHETVMASAGRELDAAKGIIATLTAELAEARAELEKETAQSKHLAEAMSRKIQELITAENQCSYYKGQYTRAEQVRKEACEANVKAQAKTLWLEDELAEAREQLKATDTRLHDVSVLCATAEQQRDSLRDECDAMARELTLHRSGYAYRRQTESLEQCRKECKSLREALRNLLQETHEPSCYHVHHSKRDQHEYIEACPVIQRHRVAVGRAVAALSASWREVNDAPAE